METVLVVEDSKLFRILKERILKKGGYQVLTAADGLEALQTAQQNRPDVILLDMMLPGLDGPGVLKALKASPATAHIPVIVVTGLSQVNETQLLGAGAAAFLEKEALLHDTNPLLSTIRKVLDSLRVGA